ncbi:MAG: hypothetical protein IT290_05740, partial [Deltaproteobacteria bacterium]|nr:hypothetical protein [Deltaproteobacteria bacterium]
EFGGISEALAGTGMMGAAGYQAIATLVELEGTNLSPEAKSRQQQQVLSNLGKLALFAGAVQSTNKLGDLALEARGSVAASGNSGSGPLLPSTPHLMTTIGIPAELPPLASPVRMSEPPSLPPLPEGLLGASAPDSPAALAKRFEAGSGDRETLRQLIRSIDKQLESNDVTSLPLLTDSVAIRDAINASQELSTLVHSTGYRLWNRGRTAELEQLRSVFRISPEDDHAFIDLAIRSPASSRLTPLELVQRLEAVPSLHKHLDSDEVALHLGRRLAVGIHELQSSGQSLHEAELAGTQLLRMAPSLKSSNAFQEPLLDLVRHHFPASPLSELTSVVAKYVDPAIMRQDREVLTVAVRRTIYAAGSLDIADIWRMGEDLGIKPESLATPAARKAFAQGISRDPLAIPEHELREMRPLIEALSDSDTPGSLAEKLALMHLSMGHTERLTEIVLNWPEIRRRPITIDSVVTELNAARDGAIVHLELGSLDFLERTLSHPNAGVLAPIPRSSFELGYFTALRQGRPEAADLIAHTGRLTAESTSRLRRIADAVTAETGSLMPLQQPTPMSDEAARIVFQASNTNQHPVRDRAQLVVRDELVRGTLLVEGIDAKRAESDTRFDYDIQRVPASRPSTDVANELEQFRTAARLYLFRPTEKVDPVEIPSAPTARALSHEGLASLMRDYPPEQYRVAIDPTLVGARVQGYYDDARKSFVFSPDLDFSGASHEEQHGRSLRALGALKTSSSERFGQWSSWGAVENVVRALDELAPEERSRKLAILHDRNRELAKLVEYARQGYDSIGALEGVAVDRELADFAAHGMSPRSLEVRSTALYKFEHLAFSHLRKGTTDGFTPERVDSLIRVMASHKEARGLSYAPAQGALDTYDALDVRSLTQAQLSAVRRDPALNQLYQRYERAFGDPAAASAMISYDAALGDLRAEGYHEGNEMFAVLAERRAFALMLTADTSFKRSGDRAELAKLSKEGYAQFHMLQSVSPTSLSVRGILGPIPGGVSGILSQIQVIPDVASHLEPEVVVPPPTNPSNGIIAPARLSGKPVQTSSLEIRTLAPDARSASVESNSRFASLRPSEAESLRSTLGAIELSRTKPLLSPMSAETADQLSEIVTHLQNAEAPGELRAPLRVYRDTMYRQLFAASRGHISYDDVVQTHQSFIDRPSAQVAKNGD